MSDSVAGDLVVLPPIFDDPIFSDLSEDEPALDDSRGIGADPHDFAGLFIKHKWSFQLHARRFLSDQRDIDEVVQEGFLKLFLAMPELETELQALAYARRTITNLCIDRYRADQRRPRLIDLESLPGDAFLDEDETDPLIQAEDAATVREALAMLSPLHRAALIKREIEEKPLPQIAAELDIPVEQVKHVLHRARRSLRRLLVGTHVEPGVDLDLAAVLRANRVRLAHAARPTGAAIIAVLMILVGLGFRAAGGRSSSPLNVAVDAGAPHRLITGLPAADPEVPTKTAQVPAATSRPVMPPRTKTPATYRPQAQPPARASAVPLTPLVVAGPIKTQPVPRPPVVAPPPAAAFVVTGVGGSGVGSMSNEQRSLRAFGRTSSSLFSASTEGGSYVLKQAFTFAADGSLSNVALGESVPVAQGAVETVVAAPRTEVEHRADGSRVVTATGLASPVASVNDGLVAARTLTVVAVLAPDLVSVLSEQVLVAPVASSDVPPVTATTPTPDPAPGLPGAPTAPPSPAGQLPSPLAGAEPALRAEAKIPAQADVPR